MKRQSLPKLADSFQQKVDRLEDSFKTTCLSMGEPLAYAQLILRSLSRHPFPSKADELRVKTDLITEELNLLKRGQSFSQRMGALLTEREEMVRFLRAELIINRKARELNLRTCCEKLEGIRLYTLTALQNLQSLASRMKVHPSEYVSSILLRLIQSTDFLRFTALRRHIQFSNGDDPLFLVPLRKFQNLELTTDYNKRSIIGLFTLTEAYQLRLHLADRFLRGADAQQQQTPELKSLQLKAKRVNDEFDYEEIIYDEAARKGRRRPTKSTKTMQKLMLPALPTKKNGLQLDPNEGMANKIRRLINTRTVEREREGEGQPRGYLYRGRRAVTQADQYDERYQPINLSSLGEGHHGDDRPCRRMKTLEYSQGRDGDDQQTPFPRGNFKNLIIPQKAQGGFHQAHDRSAAQLQQHRLKRSVVNIPPSLSLSHHEQISKLSSKKAKYQSVSKEVQDTKIPPTTQENVQSINKIRQKRRKKSTVKIIIEEPHKETVNVQESNYKEEMPQQENSSWKWFREHRENRKLDFSPEVNEKIDRLQQMAKQSQRYIITANSNHNNGNKNEKRDDQTHPTINKEEESLRYKNPIDKINEIKREKKHTVIDAARGIKSKVNTFKGGKEEVISQQINSKYESQRQPGYQSNKSFKKGQQNESNYSRQKVNPSNNGRSQHQVTPKDPQIPINMKNEPQYSNPSSSKNEDRNRIHQNYTKKSQQNINPSNTSYEDESKKAQFQEKKPIPSQNNGSRIDDKQSKKPQIQRRSVTINKQISNPNGSISQNQNGGEPINKNQFQTQPLPQKNAQSPSPLSQQAQNQFQSAIIPSKIENGRASIDDPNKTQLPSNNNPNQASVLSRNEAPTNNNHPLIPEESSLPSNYRLTYPQRDQSNIFSNPQNNYEARPIQSSNAYKQQPKYGPPVQQLTFQTVTRPSAQQQNSNVPYSNQHMNQYLNSNNNNALYGEYPEGRPNNTQVYNPQTNPKRQTDSTLKRAELIQKCVFVSKSMEQSVMSSQLREFNKEAWRHLEGYLTTSYFKNRHIMMTTCIFKDQMASYCLHYPYVTKHGRFVFILNLEVSQQFSLIEPQLVSTFFKYIFANDPTTKIIFLRHKQLSHQYFTSVLQGQPYFAGEIKTPIKGGQLAEKSLLFERRQLKCSKDLEFTNIMNGCMLYITPVNSLELSNPKFKDAYFSSTFLKRMQNSLKKQEAKKFLNYNQVASYLQQQRLPQFTKCKHDSEMLLFSQFFDDCLVNVRYFVYSKYFYFTIEPPYSYLFESQYVYYILLSTSVERKYFILADKIYEQNQNIDLYQDFRANVLNKKISEISNEDKRGTIVACPQFKKNVQLQFSGNGTGILSFGLNWKEYIKGVRYFSEEEVKVEMIGPFFCGLVEVDESNQITQIFSALIGENDLIK